MFTLVILKSKAKWNTVELNVYVATHCRTNTHMYLQVEKQKQGITRQRPGQIKQKKILQTRTNTQN